MEKTNICACGCGLPCHAKFIRGHSSRLRGRNKKGEKRCPECGLWKPETAEYFPRSADRTRGFAGLCKPCHVAVGKRNLDKRFAKDPERYRKKWRAYQRASRARNPEAHAAIRRKSRQKIRFEMHEAYGGKCSCCGEAHTQFLTLEHVNGDGAKHRAKIKTGGGNAIWLDLKRRGWPQKGFTLLCWNCHMATCRGHPCPHKTEQSK